MKFFQKIFKSPNFWPIVIVLVASILAGRSLIFEKGYFNMHDDLQMMRQLELEKCINDGQIPCRWVPDMGYGYGFPLFNFYPPLPYFVGQIFRVLQFSFVDTAKLTFALSFILSGLTMYYLAKEFFGKWGGVVSSIFYVWAPYHSVDVYVRGAMNESWALIWFPLILLTSYKLIKEKKHVSKWVIALSLSWVGLLTSHNLMVMIFTPVFAFWCLMFWIKERNLKKIGEFALSGAIALGLAAFFTIPAVTEQKLVHVDTLVQGYYEYIAHFATIGQLLFTRFWGYGPSIWGPEDGMPFQVGHVHWILSLVILGISLLLLVKKKIKKDNREMFYVVFFAIAFGWFAAFMAHQNSTPIWQQIKPLSFTQFPWRFLTLVILGLSLASGAIVKILEPYKKLKSIIPVALVVFVIIFNWNYFMPLGGKMGKLTDEEKFSGAAWDLQRTAGIFDYLPKGAKQNPKDPPKYLAEVVTGKGEVGEALAGTNWGKFNVDLKEDSVVRINLFDFPTWNITVDGQKVSSYIPETEVYGRMHLNVPKGTHTVYLRLLDTPVRKISNYISLASWAALFAYLIWKQKKAAS